jgi:hypothetical protein
MPPLKFAVMVAGFVLFGSAAGVVGYDIFVAMQLRRLLPRKVPRLTESGQVKACAVRIR